MLTHKFVFLRDGEYDWIERDNTVAGNAWLIGYARSALYRGWNLISIITDEKDDPND